MLAGVLVLALMALPLAVIVWHDSRRDDLQRPRLWLQTPRDHDRDGS